MSLRKLLGGLLGGAPIYVRFNRDRLSLRDSGSGRVFEDAPIMAVSTGKPGSVLGVGREAGQKAVLQRVPYELVNGFSHPRTVIGDFLVAQKTLSHFLKELLKPGLMRPSPVMVMHPLEEYAGGLSQIEVRALLELAAGAGAREAYVWVGRELTSEELRNGLFKSGPDRLTGKSRFETG